MTLAGLIRRSSPCALIAVSAALVTAPAASAANTMSVQPDGKIVLAGAAPQVLPGGDVSTSLPAIVRFNPTGALDRGFASEGGLVDFRQMLAGPFSALAVTSRAIFGGYEAHLDEGYRLLRFEGDGDVDANFGVEGVAPSPPVGPGTSVISATPSTILPTADGSVLAGGTVTGTSALGGFGAAFAHLFRADGGFSGWQGEVSNWAGNAIGVPVQRDLVRAADGSLVMVGTLTDPTGGTRGFLARLLPGGLHDPAFGDGIADEKGLVPLAAEALGSRGAALAVDPAGGYVAALDLVGRPALARFAVNGVRDETFGESGVARIPFGETIASGASAVAIQPDGRVLLAGWSLQSCSTPSPESGGCWRLFVARFGSGGILDESFGDSGVTRVPRGADDDVQPVSVDVASLADGSTLLSAAPSFRTESEFLVARLDPSGHLDPGFGQAGVATAAPCQGTVAERRRSGCLSHAFANLHADDLAQGNPHGSLRLSSDNLLDPMVSVGIVLPRALRGTPKLSKRLRVLTVPRSPVGKRVRRNRLIARFNDGARGVTVGFRAGIVRRVRRVKPGHKLVFVVVTTFKDGSSQRTPVRLAP